MHRSSGLLDEIPNGVSLADAEFQTLEYIQRFAPVEGKAPLAGNTHRTDRMFLAKYIRGSTAGCITATSMSRASKNFRAGGIRVRTSRRRQERRTPCPRRHPRVDRELAYYRAAGFVPQPGPTSEEARQSPRRPCTSFARSTYDIIVQLSASADTWWL